MPLEFIEWIPYSQQNMPKTGYVHALLCHCFPKNLRYQSTNEDDVNSIHDCSTEMDFPAVRWNTIFLCPSRAFSEPCWCNNKQSYSCKVMAEIDICRQSFRVTWWSCFIKLDEPLVDDPDCLLPNKRIVRLVECRFYDGPMPFPLGSFSSYHVGTEHVDCVVLEGHSKVFITV